MHPPVYLQLQIILIFGMIPQELVCVKSLCFGDYTHKCLESVLASCLRTAEAQIARGERQLMYGFLCGLGVSTVNLNRPSCQRTLADLYYVHQAGRLI